MPDPGINKFELSVANIPLNKSLKQILDFIGGQMPISSEGEEALFKSKIVLTELLTNAIKHAGASETILCVIIKDNCDIVIEKKDYGNRFDPGDKLTHPNGIAEKTIQLSKDSMHSVYAVKEKNNLIKFVCEDNSDESPDIQAIEEHFGLLIITKAANEFTYLYNEISGLNTFKALLKLC